MKAFEIAKSVYYNYSFKEGNEHIASEYNLYHILKYCKSIEAKNVLELGTGIGTILSLFQESEKVNFLDLDNYVGTEENEFCLTQIKKNCLELPEKKMKIQILNNASSIGDEKFDFAVVDGSAPNLKRVVQELLSEHAILIIEGFRMEQVDSIKMYLSEKNIRFTNFLRFSTFRNPAHGPFNQPFQAGHTVFYINPTKSEQAFCYFMVKLARVRTAARKIFDIRSWH